ncbi:MAG: hypothetical protein ACP5XB_31160 [Isosphaeraceae bacterium]
MRFDYAEREVDPLPWESGLQVIKEPIIPVRFIGPLRTYLIRGLVDTGASMTLLPRLYLTKLGWNRVNEPDCSQHGTVLHTERT